jgi:hypothetical protein
MGRGRAIASSRLAAKESSSGGVAQHPCRPANGTNERAYEGRDYSWFFAAAQFDAIALGARFADNAGPVCLEASGSLGHVTRNQ